MSTRVLQLPTAQASGSDGSSLEVAAGVWQTDAADGYIGLVVYDSTLRMAMRIEVLKSAYSPSMLSVIKGWVG